MPSAKVLKLLASKMQEVEDEMERLRQVQTVLGRLHKHGVSLVKSQATT